LFENDLKSKSQFENLISNRDFKSFDFKSYPTLIISVIKLILIHLLRQLAADTAHTTNTICQRHWVHMKSLSRK